MIAKRWIILAGVAVAVVVAGAVWFVHFTATGPGESASSPDPSASSEESRSPEREEISRWGPGSKPPETAVDSARRLVSPDLEQRRSALTPDLNEALPPGGEVPAGADIVLDDDGWRAQGDYAIATGHLIMPDAPDQLIVIGFRDVSGRWLVTFQEDVP